MTIPWSDWLQAALRAGLGPDAFWRLSLAEWRLLQPRGSALTRGEFDALLAAHPDEKTDGH